jgi:hypothetical protein
MREKGGGMKGWMWPRWIGLPIDAEVTRGAWWRDLEVRLKEEG